MKSQTPSENKPKENKPKSKSVKPARPKKKAAASEAPAPILDAETRRTQRRVAQLRDKLRHALDDPEKRKQMVEAIRFMMRGDEN